MEAPALNEDHLVLGRYRPLRPLGTGGSGSVWLARDERNGREVALKAVAREGKAASRAEREAEAVARLRHPRCPRALAVGRDERHVYVAYEYVPGRTLREALRGGELDDRAAVEAAAQLLEALAHAHAQGVVHRDVKPANVMLHEGNAVAVRLLDFGLARLDEADTLTAAGDVPGTLAYVAPERLAGSEASGAADVWSVGVVLWEALAGGHPFWAASPVATARKIAAGAPPLARARPDLPGELCALVDRMLSLDPKRRPRPKRLAGELRTALAARGRPTPRPLTRQALALRLPHASLAGLFAAGTALLLPFFPHGWPPALGALAALAALASPRAGLALALAVPVLPLGNVALGLAVVYGVGALVWLALFWSDPRSSLLFAAAPLLALVGALALVPVLSLAARGALRQVAQAAAALPAAAAVAAVTGSPLPLTQETPPLSLGLAGSERPLAVAHALVGFFATRPELALEALVLAAAALAARFALAHSLWGGAIWGSAFLAAAVLLPPLAGAGRVAALPLAAGAWAAAALLAFRAARTPATA